MSGELLKDAAARGLTHFSLTRKIGSSGMWQASTRWTWSDGYRVAIEPSAEEAAVKALSMQPVSSQRVSTVPTPLDDGDPTAADTEVAEMIEADDPAGRAAYDADVRAGQSSAFDEDIFG